MPRSYVEEYSIFRRRRCFRLQCSRLRREPELYSETSVHIYQTTQRSVSEEVISTNSSLDTQREGTLSAQKESTNNPYPCTVLFSSLGGMALRQWEMGS